MAQDPKSPNRTCLQKAIVFGTVKEKARRGRWLVNFENNMNLTLRANEFFLVSEDKTQSVISTTNDTNTMILKDPKTDIIDLTSARRNTKSVLVDLTTEIKKEKETIDLSGEDEDDDRNIK